MSATGLSVRDIRRLVDKLGLTNLRQGKETLADYCLDGKLVYRVKLPNEHGGSGRGVSTGLLKSCSVSFHLTLGRFAELVLCTFTGPDYETHVRDREKLPPG